jgi:retron-type reverse transcriptase
LTWGLWWVYHPQRHNFRPFNYVEQNDPGNYRPISVLSIISRILEKCFSIRMMSFLEDHKLLVETQFGFRRKRTTEQAMIYLTTIINDVLDKGFKIGAIYLDPMKAFDTVDHELLLKKCEVYGLRGKS